jgi:hypothetical protein
MNRMASGTIAGVLAGIVFAVIAFSGDPIIATDTSFYLSIADGLQNRPAEVLLAKDKVRVTVLTLPILLIIARQVAPDRWPYLIVFVNVVCLAAVAGLLVVIVRKVTQSALAAFVALLFYVTGYDVVAWLRYVLTDNIFALAATVVFYLLIRGIVQDEPTPRRRIALGFALFASFITRATGSVLVPVVVFSEWWSHRRAARGGIARVGPWILLLVVFTGGLFGRLRPCRGQTDPAAFDDRSFRAADRPVRSLLSVQDQRVLPDAQPDQHRLLHPALRARVVGIVGWSPRG